MTHGFAKHFLIFSASNDALKMLYDVKPVPMDPDKMTAGISFVNVGQNAIVSVELDFHDSSNISAVRDNPEKGIKIDMELGPGKTEDHLVLFNVSKLLPKGSARISGKSKLCDKSLVQ